MATEFLAFPFRPIIDTGVCFLTLNMGEVNMQHKRAYEPLGLLPGKWRRTTSTLWRLYVPNFSSKCPHLTTDHLLSKVLHTFQNL